MSAEPFYMNLCVVVVNHVFYIRRAGCALEKFSEFGETAQGIRIPIRAGSGFYSHLFEHRAQSLKTLLKAVVIHIGSLCPARLGDSPEAREAHI